MRFLFVLTALATVSMILANDCPNNEPSRECSHMHCDLGYEVSCDHTICTCLPSTSLSCNSQLDCNDPHCPPMDQHCIDNYCKCVDAHPGGPGGPGGPIDGPDGPLVGPGGR